MTHELITLFSLFSVDIIYYILFSLVTSLLVIWVISSLTKQNKKQTSGTKNIIISYNSLENNDWVVCYYYESKFIIILVKFSFTVRWKIFIYFRHFVSGSLTLIASKYMTKKVLYLIINSKSIWIVYPQHVSE